MITVSQLNKKLESLEAQVKKSQASKWESVIIYDIENPPTDEQFKKIAGRDHGNTGMIIILPDNLRNPKTSGKIYSRHNC